MQRRSSNEAASVRKASNKAGNEGMGIKIMRMMAFMQGWKLTKKFLVSILLVLAAVMTIMVVVLSIHQKGVLIEELNKKGKNTAEFLAGISAEPVLSYNCAYLENYVRDAARDQDIASIVIQDKQGNPLTHQKKKTNSSRQADRSQEKLWVVV
jgi:sensor histidine kinase regulating citrate/malate metabolism